DFPVRIHYVNFAEHLQNAYNVNVLFESEINRWNLTDWEQDNLMPLNLLRVVFRFLTGFSKGRQSKLNSPNRELV
ncbi:MAG: hypothetical protein LBU34_14790, partial [Planctomycetaceae bacterium]|nr:hypothetical protein [Planctomycetaceae bacterium]